MQGDASKHVLLYALPCTQHVLRSAYGTAFATAFASAVQYLVYTMASSTRSTF
jgi:hypothetical protein